MTMRNDDSSRRGALHHFCTEFDALFNGRCATSRLVTGKWKQTKSSRIEQERRRRRRCRQQSCEGSREERKQGTVQVGRQIKTVVLHRPLPLMLASVVVVVVL